MQYYKDTNNKVHVLDDVAFEHLLPPECVTITKEEADELTPNQTQAQLKSDELSALYAAYSSDMKMLQDAWISALIADGEFEDARKADVVAEMAEVEAQFSLDAEAIELKYQP